MTESTARPHLAETGNRSYERTVLVVVMLAVTAFGSLMTIVTVALGEIAADLDSSRATLTWVITGLMLAMAVTTPIGGKLGDLRGHRTMFLIGLGGGVVTTVLSGLAWDATSLIAVRVLFGVFGALVIPNAQALMMDAYGPARRATAMGWFQFAMTGAPTIGLVIGGPLIEIVGWRNIFFVFAGVNLLALAAGALLVRPSPRQADATIDYAGAATLALAVLAGLLAITRVASLARDESLASAVADPLTWALAVVCAGGGAAFVLVEGRVESPMVRLEYFSRRAFTMPMVSSALVQFAYMGGFVVTPALLDVHYGWSIGAIALLMAPRPGAFSLSSILGGYLPTRIGLRTPIVLGAVCMVLSMLAFAIAAPGSAPIGIAVILVGLVLSGMAAGVSGPSVAAMVVDAADDTDVGIASGMSQQVMFIGVVVGIQTMNVLVGDGAGVGRFVTAYLLGAAVAGAGLAAALAIPTRGRIRSTGQPAPGAVP